MKDFFKNLYRQHFNVFAALSILLSYLFFLIPSFNLNQKNYSAYEMFFLNGINNKSAIFLVLLILMGLGIITSFIPTFEIKFFNKKLIIKDIYAKWPIFFCLLSSVISIASYSLLVNFNKDLGDLGIMPGIIFSDIFLVLGTCIALGFSLQKTSFSTNEISHFGILIALALILDFIDFFKMPTGGSISLTMLPLMILCLKFGVIKGFIGSGIVYGLTTCLLDGYGLMTYPLDYLLGFGSLCIIGFYTYIEKLFKIKNTKVLKYIVLSLIIAIAVTFRVLFSTISSVVYYEYSFVAGLIYNCPYCYVSYAICLPFILILFSKKVLNISIQKDIDKQQEEVIEAEFEVEENKKTDN